MPQDVGGSKSLSGPRRRPRPPSSSSRVPAPAAAPALARASPRTPAPPRSPWSYDVEECWRTYSRLLLDVDAAEGHVPSAFDARVGLPNADLGKLRKRVIDLMCRELHLAEVAGDVIFLEKLIRDTEHKSVCLGGPESLRSAVEAATAHVALREAIRCADVTVLRAAIHAANLAGVNQALIVEAGLALAEEKQRAALLSPSPVVHHDLAGRDGKGAELFEVMDLPGVVGDSAPSTQRAALCDGPLGVRRKHGVEWRHFALFAEEFSYYRHEAEMRWGMAPQGSTPVSEILQAVAVADGIAISLKSKRRPLELTTESRQEATRWLLHLRAAVESNPPEEQDGLHVFEEEPRNSLGGPSSESNAEAEEAEARDAPPPLSARQPQPSDRRPAPQQPAPPQSGRSSQPQSSRSALSEPQSERSQRGTARSRGSGKSEGRRVQLAESHGPHETEAAWRDAASPAPTRPATPDSPVQDLKANTRRRLLEGAATGELNAALSKAVAESPRPATSEPPSSSRTPAQTPRKYGRAVSRRRSERKRSVDEGFEGHLHAQGNHLPAVGEQVVIGHRRVPATCRFVGTTAFNEGLWVGLELQTPVGKTDGSVNGVRYFSCKPRHGVFVRSALVYTWNEAIDGPAKHEIVLPAHPPAASSSSAPPPAAQRPAQETARVLEPPPLGPAKVKLTIIGATGLRNADWLPGDTSDPYCVCEVAGHPSSTFQTAVVWNNLNPVWNHEEDLGILQRGEDLAFRVYDKDIGRSDFLGRTTLASAAFFERGFEGTVRLLEAGEGQEAYLRLKVEVERPKEERAPAPAADPQPVPAAAAALGASSQLPAGGGVEEAAAPHAVQAAAPHAVAGAPAPQMWQPASAAGAFQQHVRESAVGLDQGAWEEGNADDDAVTASTRSSDEPLPSATNATAAAPAAQGALAGPSPPPLPPPVAPPPPPPVPPVVDYAQRAAQREAEAEALRREAAAAQAAAIAAASPERNVERTLARAQLRAAIRAREVDLLRIAIVEGAAAGVEQELVNQAAEILVVEERTQPGAGRKGRGGSAASTPRTPRLADQGPGVSPVSERPTPFVARASLLGGGLPQREMPAPKAQARSRLSQRDLPVPKAQAARQRVSLPASSHSSGSPLSSFRSGRRSTATDDVQSPEDLPDFGVARARTQVAPDFGAPMVKVQAQDIPEFGVAAPKVPAQDPPDFGVAKPKAHAQDFLESGVAAPKARAQDAAEFSVAKSKELAQDTPGLGVPQATAHAKGAPDLGAAQAKVPAASRRSLE